MGIHFFPLVLWCGLISLSSGGRFYQLALIHTNDVHGRIEQTNGKSGPCGEKDRADDKCYGGVARMWTKIKELREENPDISLLVDTGDQFHGTLWSSYYKGLETSFFMNKMGYDIMTLGHNEFDYGMETVKRFIENVTFPVVASNINAGDTILKDTFVTSHYFTINEEKVGFIGFITTRMPVIVDAANIEGLKFTDEVEAVRKEAVKLKSEGVGIIIVLGHSGHLYDKIVAKEVDEVDIVIGGHSNTFLYTGTPPSTEVPLAEYPVVYDRPSGRKALVVTAYAYTKYLGFIKVNFNRDGLKLVSWEGQPILLDSSIPEDPEMKALVEQWSEPLTITQEAAIGSSLVKLEGDSTGRERVCRRRECSLGNVVADAVLWSYVKSRTPTDTEWSDVSIALWNSGAIRIDLNQGPITLEDVKLALPYRNSISLVEVTRCVLLDILEHSVSQFEPSPSGRYLQMSGMRVKFNLTNPVGERVVSVMVRCTECIVPEYVPIQECGIYKVLLSSFMLSGGDGFGFIPKKGLIETGIVVSDALKEYIQQFSPMITGLEDRIVYVTEEKAVPPSGTSPPPAPTPPPAAGLLQVAPCADNQQNLPRGFVILSNNGFCLT